MASTLRRRFGPRPSPSFDGLMGLYELNYIRLRRLLPDWGTVGAQAVSVSPRGLDLHYQLLERCPYTLTAALTYCFPRPDGGTLCAPDLRIRVYLDARLAEVMSGALHRHGPRLDVSSLPPVDLDQGALAARWRLNRFLYRWLNFCLKQGHRFRTLHGAWRPPAGA
ncbi:MAG: hypothetical protein KatS3mg121_0181 [Gammaproteobacteria bacterium]|nr:MAG: hypothetical protein KatS3mg121_0181 [Gammaproteobacteria bacterium]